MATVVGKKHLLVLQPFNFHVGRHDIDLYYSRHQGYSKITTVYSITLDDDI